MISLIQISKKFKKFSLKNIQTTGVSMVCWETNMLFAFLKGYLQFTYLKTKKKVRIGYSSLLRNTVISLLSSFR